MMPDLLQQPDIVYSYIIEVKYARRNAFDADILQLKREAAEQLVRYAADEKVLRTKGGTKLELLMLVFKGGTGCAGEAVILQYTEWLSFGRGRI